MNHGESGNIEVTIVIELGSGSFFHDVTTVFVEGGGLGSASHVFDIPPSVTSENEQFEHTCLAVDETR